MILEPKKEEVVVEKTVEDFRSTCRPLEIKETFIGMQLLKEGGEARTSIIAVGTDKDGVGVATTTAVQIKGETRSTFSLQELFDEWLLETPDGFLICGQVAK